MRIAGVQPLSLIDYPQKPCSIVFTQGCIFRCSYCHNPDLIPFKGNHVQSGEQVIAFLDSRKKFIDSVCISGGEPTLQSGLKDFIRSLKALGFFVKLDTNGIRPEIVADLIDTSLLDYIAMDLKAPWEKYLRVIKIGTRDTIEACKKTQTIIQNSQVEHEFRTTISPGVHTKDDFFDMAGTLQPGERYFVQQTSFTKTLEPLDSTCQLDAKNIVQELTLRFPLLYIDSR